MGASIVFPEHPICIDCGKKPSEIRHTGQCTPSFTVVYVCRDCFWEREKYWEQYGHAKCTGQEIELCVMCGVETLYAFITPAEFREHYIEGAGQHCESCCYKSNLCSARIYDV